MGNLITSLVSGFFKVIGDLFGAPVDFLSGKSCSIWSGCFVVKLFGVTLAQFLLIVCFRFQEVHTDFQNSGVTEMKRNSGRNGSSKCGPTWDLICYIENFCIGNLLKLLAVSVLFYTVMLFFYLLYKVGVCDCICRNMCKMLWACLASCFSSCEDGCLLTWSKLKDLKRAKRDSETDTEMYDYSWSDEDLEERISYPRRPNGLKFRRSLSCRSGERRRFHMSRSLRPRSHRVTVGISRRSAYANERLRPRRHTECVDAVHNFKVTRTSKFVQKGSGRRVYMKRYR